MDYSTINLIVLRTLSLVTRAALDAKRYHLQEDPGNGCCGDPPGYPTYYTRSVYTSQGNSPNAFPSLVIRDPENPDHFYDVDVDYDNRAQLMRSLYLPLPIDHPRVLAWMGSAAVQSHSCYVDPAGGEKRRHVASLLFWPVPSWQLQKFHDDQRFSDDWRTKAQAAVDQANSEVIARNRLVCVAENHVLMYDLREVYPDATPDTLLAGGVTPRHLMGSPPQQGSDWWERLATRPTPAECRPPGWYKGHRADGWCQFCGWRTEDGTTTDSTEVPA